MKRLLQFIIEDPWRKLMALILAGVLYVNLSEKRQQQSEISNVQITIRHAPEIYLAPADTVREVRLTVRGSENRLNALKMRDITGTIQLDNALNNLSSGVHRVRLTPDIFNCGKGVKIINIEPAVLSLPVQRQISKDIKIEPVLSGKLPAGKICTAIRSFPDRITVSGPEKLVNSLSSVRTEPLSVDGETIDFSADVKLHNPMPELSFSTTSANLAIEIKESQDIPRKFTDVPIRYLFSPVLQESGHQISLPKPGKVTVTVSGMQSDINDMSRDQLTVFADLSDSRYTSVGDHTVQLQVHLNNNKVNLSNIEPKEVKVSIRQKDSLK